MIKYAIRRNTLKQYNHLRIISNHPFCKKNTLWEKQLIEKGYTIVDYSDAKIRGLLVINKINKGDPVFLEDGKIKKTVLPSKVESILDELDREEFVEIFDDDEGNKGVVHRDIIREVLEKYIKEDVYTLKVSLTDVAPIMDVLNFAMTVATEFVAKVESGKAKSIETYANMKELIKMIHDIGK